MDLLRLHYAIESTLFTDIIPFWLKFGFDRQNGGIYTCLDRYGALYSEDKGVWMQGRTAYIFYTLCLEYGLREDWKEFADSCLKFMDAHCIDTDGRMFFTITSDGRPLRKRRYFFSESFYTISHARKYALTGEIDSLEIARKYFELMLSIYRDPSSDPYKITPKSIKETRDTKALAYPMIMLNVTVVMSECDPEKRSAYEEIVKELVKDIFAFRDPATGLMLENMLSNGEFFFESAGGRIINPGHSIELAWFLADAAKLIGDDSLMKEAEDIFWKAYEFGKDEEYGGVLYFKDIYGKPVEAYEHDMKLWWVHTEALTAAIKFYDYTQDEKYLFFFDDMYHYTHKHFADPEYGEWFGYLRKDGKPTEPPCKGHTYKGPFHVMRMLIESEKILSKLVKQRFSCDTH